MGNCPACMFKMSINCRKSAALISNLSLSDSACKNQIRTFVAVLQKLNGYGIGNWIMFSMVGYLGMLQLLTGVTWYTGNFLIIIIIVIINYTGTGFHKVQTSGCSDHFC